jgi:hypothetical protein
MMGDRRVGQEHLFYEFSLERQVPEQHLLRSVDRFVELDGLRYSPDCGSLRGNDRPVGRLEQQQIQPACAAAIVERRKWGILRRPHRRG